MPQSQTAPAPPPRPTSAAVVAPPPAARLREVLGLVHGVPPDDPAVDDFVSYAAQRDLDLTHMLAATRDGEMKWAVLPMPAPGKTSLLLCPATLPDDPLIAVECLAEAGERRLAAGDVLVQMLTAPDDDDLATAAKAAGFDPLATLIYLSRRLPPGVEADPPPGHRWLSYDAERHDLFGQAIEQSYVDSLDCPELNPIRHIEDTMAGHQAAGDFIREAWQVLLDEADRPVGVVLVCGLPGQAIGELVYLGLAPSRRGHGLGRLLATRAMQICGQQDYEAIILAADARNHPALRMYRELGFVELYQRRVLMRT